MEKQMQFGSSINSAVSAAEVVWFRIRGENIDVGVLGCNAVQTYEDGGSMFEYT
jgi:hypothetical protein